MEKGEATQKRCPCLSFLGFDQDGYLFNLANLFPPLFSQPPFFTSQRPGGAFAGADVPT